MLFRSPPHLRLVKYAPQDAFRGHFRLAVICFSEASFLTLGDGDRKEESWENS